MDRGTGTELAAWSGRHTAPDGVPSANAPARDDTLGVLPTGAFADPAFGRPPAPRRQSH